MSIFRSPIIEHERKLRKMKKENDFELSYGDNNYGEKTTHSHEILSFSSLKGRGSMTVQIRVEGNNDIDVSTWYIVKSSDGQEKETQSYFGALRFYVEILEKNYI